MKLNELYSSPRDITDFFSAQKLLRSHGFSTIDGGSYCKIYMHPNLNYVLKLFITDDGYLKFIDVVSKNKNIHFPKFRGKVMTLNPSVFAIRMERLQKIDYDEPICKLIQRTTVGDDLPDEVMKKFPELKSACDIIYTNLQLNPTLRNDIFTYSNIMQRNGIPVITDPWASKY